MTRIPAKPGPYEEAGGRPVYSEERLKRPSADGRWVAPGQGLEVAFDLDVAFPGEG